MEVGSIVCVKCGMGILQTKGNNPFWGYQESLENSWPEVPILDKRGKIYNIQNIDKMKTYGIIFNDGTIGHRIRQEYITIG